MAMAVSNAFRCPTKQLPGINCFRGISASSVSPSHVRLPRRHMQKFKVLCTAASPMGSSSSDSDMNPYEVLGVNPIAGFDKIKAAYTRQRREAERRGDEATVNRLERAYDKVMLAQLSNRKKGLTFGSFQVSKDIKYADKQPIVPWGPRFTKSSVQDIRINMGVSAFFIAWIVLKRSAEWKPVQFLAFVYVYRIFEKLKAFEPAASSSFNEEGEDEGRGLRMGKRLLRSLALVFGSVAIASVGFTFALNLIEYFLQYIPVVLYNGQEMFVTAASAVLLFIMASFYR